MTENPVPYQGFGDPDSGDATLFVRFRVRREGGGQYPDWQDGEPLGSVRQIAGTDDFDVYFGGFGPSRLTLRVWFARREDYLALRAHYRRRTVATLSLLARFTSHGGPVRYRAGQEYEEFPHTIVERITDVRHETDHRVECTVTFMRAEAVP